MGNLLQTQNIGVPQHILFVALVTLRGLSRQDGFNGRYGPGRRRWHKRKTWWWNAGSQCGVAVGEEEVAEVEVSVVEAEEQEGEEVGHFVMMITFLEFICKS